MKQLEEFMSTNLDVRTRYLQSIQEAQQKKPTQSNIAVSEIKRTTAIINIPVVFHIVLKNPFIVTDADIQAQIDRINLDFSGKNPDSTNAFLFYASRGSSEIRFCLARRDPFGNLTNGIERKTSATMYTTSTSDPIKISNLGGLDAWNASNYLNIWIGEGDGLGYSTFPNTSIASQEGIVINLIGTSTNTCYVNNNYNLGRTATHEVGHYFGLYHIWGDNPVGCTTDDFRHLPGTCPLPASFLIGDTPNQNTSTLSCPSGLRTDVCSPISPGFQYQNFMDYTNDACMTMFTKAQVNRMEWVLQNCRTTLLSSQGCIFPSSAVLLDVSLINIINPGGTDIIGCNIINQPIISCPGLFTPKIIIQNKGLTTLTTVKVGLQINASIPVIQTIAVNLSSGGFTSLILTPQVLNLGNNSLRFFTLEPNGGTDERPANDQQIININLASPINIPLTEGFENEIFPPTNWSIFNPNLNNTWVRFSSPGNGTLGAAFFDNFNNNTVNQVDELRTIGMNFSGTEDLKISFDLAHKNWTTLGEQDSLSILVSNNCGNTFTTVYKKWGPALSTAGTFSTAYLNPIPSDWRNESIIVPNSLATGGQVIVAFRNTNRYGNNIFIDNISIAPIFDRDIQLLTINDPKDILCTSTSNASVTIKNVGKLNITGFVVNLKVDNSPVVSTIFSTVNIIQNGTLKLSLPGLNGLSLGAHTIKAYITSLLTSSGTGDQNLLNDSLTKAFSITGNMAAPLLEGFESVTFPPIAWGVSNPDNDITWKKTLNGFNSSSSAFVHTYNYANIGQVDQLVTPNISFSLVDSVLLSFDLSAVTYSDPRTTNIPLDTLEVLVTKDCGNTYTSVYKKWGVALQTINDPINEQLTEFFPTNSSQWRAEKIDLTSFASNSPIQIVFRVINNFENNIFIDNVNFKTRILPDRLKKNGYLILPSPFQNNFSVWFRTTPLDLSFIQVYNVSGQKVWSKLFNKDSGNLINIDLTGKPKGVYLVNLGYQNSKSTVVEKIIKN